MCTARSDDLGGTTWSRKEHWTRPPFPKACLRFRLTFKEIRDNLGGKLWPWPYLASVGYGQRESYHPIENWIDSVLARDQLSCGFRVQVGGGGSEP